MTSKVDQHFRERLENDRYPRGYPFVTISRESGAGGRRLAAAIHEATEARRYQDLYHGWKVVDEVLCDEVMADPDMHVSLEELVREEYHTSLTDFLKDIFGKETPQFTVYQRLFQVVRTFAAIGKVIVVGRAGVRATQHIPGGVHLRLTAPLDMRQHRMMELAGIDEAEALHLMQRQDRERSKMFRDFFNRDIEDPSLYDAVWDTSQQPFEAMAEQVIKMLEQKAHEVRRI